MILGNDGGATITFNGGQTWSTQDNQPTAQFYRVITDDRFPYWVYGSQQDNSTVGMPTGVPGYGGIDRRLVRRRRRRERLDRARPAQSRHRVRGRLRRQDHPVRPSDAPVPGDRRVAAARRRATRRRDLKYRFQWNAPILISRHDPKILYSRRRT